MAIVYRHIRKDINSVFYIGIGKSLRRAFSTKNRNKYWTNIIKKTDYIVEIVAENLSWEDACELECLLISEYGRQDLNTGQLVNMTGGGDGFIDVIFTEETRKKMSNKMLGDKRNLGRKHSKESISKMKMKKEGIVYTDEHMRNFSQARKGVPMSEEHKIKIGLANKNNILSEETKNKISNSLKGRKISEETKLKLSISLKGKIVSDEAKLNMSKLVLDLSTGIFFYSAKEAADVFKIEYYNLIRFLNGSRKNKTNLIYV